jgi:hypothetical protein
MDTNREIAAVESFRSMLQVVIVYDSRASLIKAQELQFRLVRGCGGEVNFQGSSWNFVLLANSQLSRQAANEATEADIIIISASATEQLPSHIESWVRDWLASVKHKKAALVALLETELESTLELQCVRDRLQCLAKESQVDFFCKENEVTLPLASKKTANHGRALIS